MFIATAALGGRAPSVESFSVQSSDASTSSYTFGGVTLSRSGLLVVAVLVGGTFNATRTASSVSVGGNGASIIVQNDGFVNAAGSVAMALAQISLGAGSSGNIAVSIAGGNAACCAIQPFNLLDLRSTAAFSPNGAGADTATSVGTTLNIPASGVQVVAAGAVEGGAQTATGFTDRPTGGTQIDISWRFQPGWDIRMVAQTSRPLSSAGGSTRRAISAASWR